MIDVTELAVKSAYKGIRLFVEYDTPVTIRIKAKRGNLTVTYHINTKTTELDERGRPYITADVILMLAGKALDKEEERMIREGDPRILDDCLEMEEGT